MKTERKMLIVVMLVAIMLFNCIMPVFQVQAATDQRLTFELNLYKALKRELTKLSISAIYIDEQRTMIINDEEIAKVTELSLSNSELTDLTGLDVFTNLSILDLSSNELNKDSNLAVLSSLNLSALDLSSNAIEDVSMITNLDDIPNINLHNQKFNVVEIIEVSASNEIEEDASSQVTQVQFALPQILSKAGYLESEWLLEERAMGEYKPYINWSRFDHKTIKVEVAEKTSSSYVPYKDMVTLRIRISDSTNELYNSDINIFFVVVTSEERGIHFVDTNMYDAVKGQLTKDQTINEDLISHVNTEPSQIKRNLYERNYDEPQVLVITINDIINKIPSLKLADSRIKRLDGLEKFVGISKELDVSGNYIKTIDKIIELQENQAIEEEKLRARVNAQLDKISPIVAKITAAKDTIEASKDKIKESNEEIAKLEEEYEKLVGEKAALPDEKDKQEKQKEIDAVLKKIEDLARGNSEAQSEIARLEAELLNWYVKLEPLMEELYEMYNRIDKLASFAVAKLKTMTEEDFANISLAEAKSLYSSQIQKIVAMEKALTKFEAQCLIDIYGIPIKETKEETKTTEQGGETITETTSKVEIIKNPIGTYFTKTLQEAAENEWSYGKYVEELNKFRTIDTYFSMMTYCYLVRTFEFDRLIDLCQAEKYLDYEIENLEFDGLSTNHFERIKETLECNCAYPEIHVEYLCECTKEDEERDGREYPCQCTTDCSNCSQDEDCWYIESTEDTLAPIATRMIQSRSDVNTYVFLQRLKSLNIEENLIENIDEVAKLTELRILNAYDNEIIDISNVDWPSLTKLRILNLGFNGISDISSLETLPCIEELYLMENLLSGKFTFNISVLNKLKIFDVSYNQYDDIERLVKYLTYEARHAGYVDEKGNVDIAKYLADPSSVELIINNQILTMTVDKKLGLNENRKIDLPKIFNQIEQIDYFNTSFGVNSYFGNVTSDGKQVLLDTTREGNRTANVYITGTSLGFGTNCTIHYEVGAMQPISVRITPEIAEVLVGKTQQFKAEVTGDNISYKGVTWEIIGAVSAETKISDEGLLTVAVDETAEKVTVKATSVYDITKSAEAEVTILKTPTVEKKVTGVTITPETATVKKGGFQSFTATVTGENLEEADKEIEWDVLVQKIINDQGEEILPTPAEGTNILVTENELTLTIGANEEIPTLIVRAISKLDGEKFAEARVTVEAEGNTEGSTDENTQPETPISLGYTVEGDYLIGVGTKTPVEDFKTILAKDSKVVVKENGKEVTTGYIKTGMFVEIQDENGNTEKDENGNLLVYEIVVKGDINADGVADSIDSSYIKAIRNEVTRPSDIQKKAADINGDGEIGVLDSKLLLYHRAEVKDYCLDYTK